MSPLPARCVSFYDGEEVEYNSEHLTRRHSPLPLNSNRTDSLLRSIIIYIVNTCALTS